MSADSVSNWFRTVYGSNGLMTREVLSSKRDSGIQISGRWVLLALPAARSKNRARVWFFDVYSRICSSPSRLHIQNTDLFFKLAEVRGRAFHQTQVPCHRYIILDLLADAIVITQIVEHGTLSNNAPTLPTILRSRHSRRSDYDWQPGSCQSFYIYSHIISLESCRTQCNRKIKSLRSQQRTVISSPVF